jgi:hypothetical protein
MELLKETVTCECSVETIKKLYDVCVSVANELGYKPKTVDRAKIVSDAATICALQSLDTFTMGAETKVNIDLIGTVGILDVYRDFMGKENYVIVVVKDKAKKIIVKLG